MSQRKTHAFNKLPKSSNNKIVVNWNSIAKFQTIIDKIDCLLDDIDIYHNQSKTQRIKGIV